MLQNKTKWQNKPSPNQTLPKNVGMCLYQEQFKGLALAQTSWDEECNFARICAQHAVRAADMRAAPGHGSVPKAGSGLAAPHGGEEPWFG